MLKTLYPYKNLHTGVYRNNECPKLEATKMLYKRWMNKHATSIQRDVKQRKEMSDQAKKRHWETLNTYYEVKEAYLKDYILYDLKKWHFRKGKTIGSEMICGWGRDK